MSLERRFRDQYNRLFQHEDWNIGLMAQPIASFLRTPAPAVTWLTPRPHRYAADPFALVREGRMHVLFEDYDQVRAKGVISYLEVMGDQHTEPEVVIDTPTHMSYPFILQHHGDVFCLPETYRAREVSLYWAERFPYRWRKVATLLSDVDACDATVFQYQDRWWLFCTLLHADCNLRLFCWHAPELFGPWEPHQHNPIKTDRRSARPGGTPFIEDGVLYRPTQDCSRTYGGQLRITKVLDLTPTTFTEQVAVAVPPERSGPYPHGAHTLSAAGDVTCIDGKRHIFSRREFQRAFSQDAQRTGRRLLRRVVQPRSGSASGG